MLQKLCLNITSFFHVDIWTVAEIPVLNSNPDWKAVFKDNKSITSNWNTGNCEVVECKGHHDRFVCLCFGSSYSLNYSFETFVIP